MACMCGDLYCASCGPAQGFNAKSEAAFNAVFEKLEAWIASRQTVPGVVSSRVNGRHVIEKVFDNGEEDGLVRLTDFILGLMNESFQAGRQAEIEAQNDAQARFGEWLEGASDD